MICDKFKPERSILSLTPTFREKVTRWLFLCPEIFVTESVRSAERQNCLRREGFSKVAQSLHQKGLAVDIAFNKELYPEDIRKWEKVAKIAKECGIDWGYNLWGWDKCHFQDDFTELKKLTTHNYLAIAAKEVRPKERIFKEYSGENYITEKNVKLLIEIAVNRALG